MASSRPNKASYNTISTKQSCPLCAWQPQSHNLWACKCGYQWNTFKTRGLCPACNFKWSQTQCQSCKGWSDHNHWYGTPVEND